MRFFKKSYLVIYLVLYISFSIGWSLLKISWGCPCGFIVECITCSFGGSILESFLGWGIIGLFLIAPALLIFHLLDLSFIFLKKIYQKIKIDR